MELEGKIWKDGKSWLVEVPALDVCTQGHTRKEALRMIADAIEVLIGGYFSEDKLKNFKIHVQDYKNGAIWVSSSDNRLLLSFSLIRQREISKSTVREVSERLGSKSPHAYAQYERGKMRVTLDQYERLLRAVNPDKPLRLRIV